ncbi:MAG TPA: hypothetical protein VFJ22_17110 [Dermatophilaceae bacterium]|nr:hypothetical protein [Dermatophilaceae bacterium]
MVATHSKTGAAPGKSSGSRIGQWTLALSGLALAGVVLLGVAFAVDLVESAESFTDNWLLTGWGLVILASGAASVVLGAVAIIRRHERSWMVLLATLVGVLVTALMLSEVAQGLAG